MNHDENPLDRYKAMEDRIAALEILFRQRLVLARWGDDPTEGH